MFSKAESEPFLDDDETEIPSPHSQLFKFNTILKRLKHKFPKQSRGVSYLLVFLATTLLWGCVFLSVRHFHHISRFPTNTYLELRLASTEDYGNFAKNARLLSCGFSRAEAIERGCQYDILVGKWLPPLCIDQAAIETYQADESWFGYAYENRTERLDIDQMAHRDVYYTSARDHIVHCANLWRKQYQAFYEGGLVFDTIIASKEHTEHCAQFLIDMTDWKAPHEEFRELPIPVFVGQAGCFVKN
jgi:hypothetical protein